MGDIEAQAPGMVPDGRTSCPFHRRFPIAVGIRERARLLVVEDDRTRPARTLFGVSDGRTPPAYRRPERGVSTIRVVLDATHWNWRMRGAVCLGRNCLSTMPPLEVARITPKYTDDDAPERPGTARLGRLPWHSRLKAHPSAEAPHR